MNEFFTTTLMGKLIGALAGSGLSLAVLMPKGKREAALRLVVGFVCGVLGAPQTMRLLCWEGFEDWMLASAICSFLGWWVCGVVARTAGRWKTVEDVAKTVKEVKKI